ncbi:TetR/AcrR family transcriptional regulator [Rhizohabitans arisaemae]|uniref:TetR/AcrR family transcriptional regulator n=1 Tax=Rhizohabitans arisaemae TaxID=2720610 RepID=UPI0024B1BAA4|nr:TetR/AcrR family transcriptional regulator [Rhizohabitans arisaemae]
MTAVKNPRDGRLRILEGALRRFSQDGVSATTLASLREESGVSVGSFYHHFASKDHVFGVLYAETQRIYQEAFLQELFRHTEARDGITGIVAFHMAWCGRHPERARLLLTERPPRRAEPGGPEVAALRKAFFTEVASWWDPQTERGSIRQVGTLMCYVLWLGAAQETCRLWFAGVREPSEEDVAALSEAAWHSLRQDQSA